MLGSPLRLAGERSWQSTAPPPSLPRFATGHPRRRFWLALKIGAAAVVASLFSIIDSLNQLTGAPLPWGRHGRRRDGADTWRDAQKAPTALWAPSRPPAPRLAGYGTKMLLPPPYAGLLQFSSAATSTLNYLRTAPASKDWQYAYLSPTSPLTSRCGPFTRSPRPRTIGADDWFGRPHRAACDAAANRRVDRRREAKGMLADALSDCARRSLSPTRCMHPAGVCTGSSRLIATSLPTRCALEMVGGDQEPRGL